MMSILLTALMEDILPFIVVFLQLMALAVQQSASKCLLTVCQIVNSFNSLPKLQNFQKTSLACYQTGFTAQTNS